MPPATNLRKKLKWKYVYFQQENNKITNKTNWKGLILIKMMEECKIKSDFIII